MCSIKQLKGLSHADGGLTVFVIFLFRYLLIFIKKHTTYLLLVKCYLACVELNKVRAKILQFMTEIINILVSFSGDPQLILHQRRPFCIEAKWSGMSLFGSVFNKYGD